MGRHTTDLKLCKERNMRAPRHNRLKITNQDPDTDLDFQKRWFRASCTILEPFLFKERRALDKDFMGTI